MGLKVGYLIVIFIIMQIVESMSFSLNDRKFQINHSDSRESALDIGSENLKIYYDSPDLITIEQRIKRCKEEHPSYDYNSLNDNEKDELIDNSKINPCRVDCVVIEKGSKATYTVFFADGKTKCSLKKVCKRKNGVGICLIDTHI